MLHKAYSLALQNSMDVEVGYIVPGHGLHGKQEWLCDDSDLSIQCTVESDK